jgi:hypothetical protein
VRPVDQMNHERPREKLAGVRVSRQLQVEAGLLGQRRDLRIVRQKQTEGRPRIAVVCEVRTRPRVGIGHSRGVLHGPAPLLTFNHRFVFPPSSALASSLAT